MAEHQPKWRRASEDRGDGQQPGGKPPAPPTEGPLPTDQVNLTDAGVAHHAGGGRRLRRNRQCAAAVAAGSLPVVAVDEVFMSTYGEAAG